MRVKIIFITSRFPYPIEKGDKLRAYHQIKGLSTLHDVHLISISHQPVGVADRQEMLKYCKEIHVFRISKLRKWMNIVKAAFSGTPLMVGYFLDQKLKSKIQKTILDIEPDHIFAQLIRTAEYVRNLPFPKTLDYMDVFSVGMNQRSLVGWKPLRSFYRYESMRLERFEQEVYRDFDHHTVISIQDRDRLQINNTESIAVLPNGVDAEFFQRDHAEYSATYDLVFVGNMGYLPNIEAAEFLVKKVMPKLPDHVRLMIAGARPHHRVKQLVSDRVIISGWMDDIRKAYTAGRVFVAPIFSGMGQQNKILEAMAMQLPSVTSTMVNNAIHAKEGKEILIADDAEGFALKIMKLLEDEIFAGQIGEEARTFVIKAYSWKKQIERLDQIIKRKSILHNAKDRSLENTKS